jgi:DNA invertase Pin-like site-specific DNA recombinase
VANLKRVALYARVSTSDQTCENQLQALRAHATARGWQATEFIDHGVSGAKERRPQLDALLSEAKRRTFDVVLVTKLDRLARSVHHLVSLGREFAALGVDLVALDQAIDTTTPSGRLLFNVLASIAEFERDLIADRVVAGLKRARAQGTRLGRPRVALEIEARIRRELAKGHGIKATARLVGVGTGTVQRLAVAK